MGVVTPVSHFNAIIAHFSFPISQEAAQPLHGIKWNNCKIRFLRPGHKKCHYRGAAGERLENQALRLKALQAYFYCYFPPQGLWEKEAKSISGVFVLCGRSEGRSVGSAGLWVVVFSEN